MLYRIATFTLPETARTEFELQSARAMDFIRTLSGYVSDTKYEKVTGPGAINLVTVVGWKDAESIEAAGPILRAHHAENGFDPAEFRSRTGIAVEEAVFATR